MNQPSIPQWGRAALKLLGVNASVSTDDVEGDLPIDTRAQIMTAPQQALYCALIKAAGIQATVLPKVRLTDFLCLTDRTALALAISMDRVHVDFLLADSQSMKPLAVVQLISGVRPFNRSNKGRQAFIANALKSSGITALGIRQRDDYPIEALRRKLLPHLYHAAQSLPVKSDSPMGSTA